MPEYKKKNGSPVKRQAVALADELLSVAQKAPSEPASKPHDWLDDNGANLWDVWNVYLQDQNNGVYTAKLSIANSKDGKKSCTISEK